MGKRLTRHERAAVARAASIAAAHYGIYRPLIFLPTRCKLKVTTARQVAMYLANCTAGIPINRLTIAFKRDNSTISHDIQKIEDMRDEGSPFDAEIGHLEQMFTSGEPVKARAA